jgi:exodeoxyribonuclease VII large subunit
MVKENIPEYSVTEISKSIKQVLDDTFGYVRVRGEISGLKQAASGHVYLNLKDESAIINGIIWKSNVSRLSFQPHDGLEVICKGRLTTGYSDRYPGRSDYSIHIDSLMPAGEGALMALLEQRKKKFTASGLFDQIHKKQMPKYPHRIGVITSPTGAVIQDILHRIEERYPLNVILWPVPVQGDDSSELIAQAIRGFNNIDIEELIKPDVIIVARGGGSIEDLWAFNE